MSTPRGSGASGSTVLALDPGSCTWQLSRPAEGVVVSEPAELVQDSRKVRPVRRGALVDPEAGADLLRSLAWAGRTGVSPGVKLLVAVPDQEAAGADALRTLGAGIQAGDMVVVESSLAAALGAGLHILTSEGLVVCDIGGEITEVTVLSRGRRAARATVDIGGEDFKLRVVDLMSRREGIEIGVHAAGELLSCIGSLAFAGETPHLEFLRPLDAARTPGIVSVTGGDLRRALRPDLDRIRTAISGALAAVPGGVGRAARANGVLLTGGGSMLPGFGPWLERETGVSVRRAPRPLDAVSLGLTALMDKEDLARAAAELVRVQ